MVDCGIGTGGPEVTDRVAWLVERCGSLHSRICRPARRPSRPARCCHWTNTNGTDVAVDETVGTFQCATEILRKDREHEV